MSAPAERGEARSNEPLYTRRSAAKSVVIGSGLVGATSLIDTIVLDKQEGLPTNSETFKIVGFAAGATLASAAILATGVYESHSQGDNANGTGSIEVVDSQPTEQPQQSQRGSERLLSRRGIIFPGMRLNPSQS